MRGWIPPLPLACGMLAFGLSWVALFELARSGSFDASFLAFGWIHIVALGWVTLVALAILLHVIPGFLDVEWRARPFALWCTVAYALGVITLLAGFFCVNVSATEWGATITFIALIAYGGALAQPLGIALRAERADRAVARAFGATFALLLVTAALGTAFTYAFGGRLNPAVLAHAPQAHALLGIGGWLSLLVFGVSARTMRPITGARSRWLALHVVATTSLALGTLGAAVGAAFSVLPVLLAGAALLLVGAIVYAFDIADILRRANVTHRPPQIFMACGAAWAIIAAVLALGAALGKPWAAAAIYAGLLGWIGSAVLAHLHHIGVRVLLTTIRGVDDETRPGVVLIPTLSFATVALFEAAVLLGVIGIPNDARIVECAAVAGFGAFAVMSANLARAAVNARHRNLSVAP